VRLGDGDGDGDDDDEGRMKREKASHRDRLGYREEVSAPLSRQKGERVRKQACIKSVSRRESSKEDEGRTKEGEGREQRGASRAVEEPLRWRRGLGRKKKKSCKNEKASYLPT
jgi:hypothetical protein